MTVREITTVAHHYTVSGEGYSFDGQVQRTTGDAEPNLDYVMFPCALCNDSDIQDGAVVGDPTEGALYVLAQKGGVDVRQFRENHPRIASVPFDSDYKFMATFHTMPGRRRHARRTGLREGRTGRDPGPVDLAPGCRAAATERAHRRRCARRSWPRTSASPARVGASSPSPSASSTPPPSTRPPT